MRVRPDRVRALLGAEIPTQEMVERLAPIGFEAVADQGGVLDVSLPVVAAGLRARGRRDRGDRPPRRLRAARTHRAEVRGGRPALAHPGPAAAAAPGALRARDQRGHAQPLPRARRPGPGRARRARPDDRQPARGRGERPAHLAPTGSVQGGGLQRVAPLRRRRPVRDRPHLLAGGGSAARRAGGPRRRAGRAGGPGRRARAAGGGRRARAGRPDAAGRGRADAGGRAGRACTPGGAAS